jgi:predicted RNA-binding protein YlxR (DUF448 family)
VRFTVVEGVLTPGRTLAGRGAYTCRRVECFEQALVRKAFRRVLPVDVTVEPELARLYTEWSDG